MLISRPFLKSNSVFQQLIMLGFIVVLCFLIVLIVGILLTIPFFGTQVMTVVTKGIDFTVPFELNVSKYLQIISQLGMFVLPPFVFAYLFSEHTPQYLSINKPPAIVFILLAIVIIIAISPLINFLAAWNEQLQLPEALKNIELWMKEAEQQANNVTQAFLATSDISVLLLNIFMIAILPAIGEELLFRGLLIKLFIKGFKNLHIAVFLSAVLFSAFHMQFYGFVPRMLLGLLFGYIFIYTNNLWLPIIMHFINNASAVILMFLIHNNYISAKVDTIGSDKNHWWLVLLSTLVCAAIFIVFWKKREKTVATE